MCVWGGGGRGHWVGSGGDVRARAKWLAGLRLHSFAHAWMQLLDGHGWGLAEGLKGGRGGRGEGGGWREPGWAQRASAQVPSRVALHTAPLGAYGAQAARRMQQGDRTREFMERIQRPKQQQQQQATVSADGRMGRTLSFQNSKKLSNCCAPASTGVRAACGPVYGEWACLPVLACLGTLGVYTAWQALDRRVIKS